MNSNYINSISQLVAFIGTLDFSQLVLLADDNTWRDCREHIGRLHFDHTIILPAGEKSKTLDSCKIIWDKLLDSNVDRHAILLNLGGGVITDIGGFCASTFKRGIRFIHIPTSLLAMVDAAIGGKTGIDYKDYKNVIGTFSNPVGLCIDPVFLNTLPDAEWLNGYAEIYKHGLIYQESLFTILNQHEQNIKSLDWSIVLDKAIQVKMDIVSQDPFEKNLRKTLNFGHTIGHGIESIMMQIDNPISHGMAVAIGMICESFLASFRKLISTEERSQIENQLISKFDLPRIDTHLFSNIADYSKNDKKNKDGQILCVLIGPIGSCTVDHNINESDIVQSLEHYNRLLN